MPDDAIRVGVLGPVVAAGPSGELVQPASPLGRTLLACLALAGGRVVSADLLAEALWPEEAGPRDHRSALHTLVSRLRSGLHAELLQRAGNGYRLGVASGDIDLHRARAARDRARAQLAAGDAATAAVTAATALGWWRGNVGTDISVAEVADDLAGIADGLRIDLTRIRADALYASGSFDAALLVLETLCAQLPLDEPAHAQLMRCSYRLGQESRALTVYAEFGDRVGEALGIDPSPALRDLHTAILQHDESAIGGAPVRRTGPQHEDPSVPAVPVDEQPATWTIGLRAAPNPLIGRAADVTAALESLRHARLTTLLGPGGVGKTRMANELGRRVAERDGIPVVLVELAPLRGADDVSVAVSATLGIRETDIGARALSMRVNLHERLHSVVSARPMLLILDNCEHVLASAAATAADLIAAAPQLTVLTTSRAPLGVAAETVYALPPLALPGDQPNRLDTGTAASAQPVQVSSPATDLFVARAKAARPDVRLDPASVRTLCARLDGLPLAIELAAARVRTASVEDIINRLGRRLDYLRTADPTSPERHRTLQAVIEWSANLLDERQRAFLQRLSVFPASFDADAAGMVAGGSPDDGDQSGPADADDVEDTLDALVSQSLLVLTEEPAPVGVRYSMLATVHEFAAHELTRAGETDRISRRLAEWARHFSTGIGGDLLGGDQIGAFRRMEAEQDNLVAGMRWAIEHDDRRAAPEIFGHLSFYWAMSGAHAEVIAWAGRIVPLIALEPIDAAQANHDSLALCYHVIAMHMLFVGAQRTCMLQLYRLRRLVRLSTALSPDIRPLCVLVVALGNPDRTKAALHAALASPHEQVRTAANVLIASGLENAGRIEAARRSGLRLYESTRHGPTTWARSTASRLIGSLYAEEGDYAPAADWLARSIADMTELHIHHEVFEARVLRAICLIGIGQVDEGRALLAGPRPAGPGSWEQAYGSAMIAAALAEADLAQQARESGLTRYRQAADMAHAAVGEHTPENHFVVIANACAQLAAGRADNVVEDIARVVDDALLSLKLRGPFTDVPLLATAALAAATWLVWRGDPDAPALLAIATHGHARQDLPTMRIEPLRRLAIRRLGQPAVDAAAATVAGLRHQQTIDELQRSLTAVRPRLVDPTTDDAARTNQDNPAETAIAHASD